MHACMHCTVLAFDNNRILKGHKSLYKLNIWNHIHGLLLHAWGCINFYMHAAVSAFGCVDFCRHATL